MHLPLLTGSHQTVLRAAACALTLALAGPALADPAGPPPPGKAEAQPEATLAGIAQARDEADRLIAEAGAADLFDNITDSLTPRIRHRLSGLICRFGSREHNQLFVYDGPLTRGDNIGCFSFIPGLDIELRVFATRFPGEVSPQQALDLADHTIQSRYPAAVRYEGQIAIAGRDGMPTPIASGWRLDVDGRELLSMVLIVHNTEWSFKARAAGPIEDAMAISIVAGGDFLMSLEGVDGWPSEPMDD